MTAAAAQVTGGNTTGTAKVTVKEDTANGTVYIVLKKDGAAWKPDGPMQRARSANEAVKQAAELRMESKVDAAGTYIAIPARSFNPITVQPQTVTTLKLEEAK